MLASMRNAANACNLFCVVVNLLRRSCSCRVCCAVVVVRLSSVQQVQRRGGRRVGKTKHTRRATDSCVWVVLRVSCCKYKLGKLSSARERQHEPRRALRVHRHARDPPPPPLSNWRALKHVVWSASARISITLSCHSRMRPAQRPIRRQSFSVPVLCGRHRRRLHSVGRQRCHHSVVHRHLRHLQRAERLRIGYD